MAHQYEFISSDTHLEVLPERWTGRVPAKYRDKMPRTVPHPDGGDALQIEGAPLFQVAYLDLRAGRTAEDWQPFGVSVASCVIAPNCSVRVVFSLARKRCVRPANKSRPDMSAVAVWSRRGLKPNDFVPLGNTKPSSVRP